MAACCTMFSASAVFPIDGRAARTTRSDRWNPAVYRSRSTKPLGTPVTAPAELVAQRDGVDDVAAFSQRQHRPEQQAMALLVEHRVVQDLRGLERRILVEQHRA